MRANINDKGLVQSVGKHVDVESAEDILQLTLELALSAELHGLISKSDAAVIRTAVDIAASMIEMWGELENLQKQMLDVKEPKDGDA